MRQLAYGVLLSASLVAVNAGLLGERANAVQAASGFHYQRGYSVQNGWLCYGFTDRAETYHCTQRWYRSAHGYVSLHVPFVPSQLETRTHVSSTGHVGAGTTHSTLQATAGQPCHEKVAWPAVIRQWSVPLGCYARIYHPNPARYPLRPGYGWCNWWPEVLHPGLPGGSVLHQPRHTTPRVGAVVWFAPGVQGASAAGHYAQVVAIHGNWLLVTEMNFYWRGGGFGKVDYRFIHTGSGVSFLY